MTKNETMRCPICRAPMLQEDRLFIAEWNGEEVQIEDVPTWICEQCDHVQVDDEVIEAVEDMLAHLTTVVDGRESSEEE